MELITLKYKGGLTDSQQRVFGTAAKVWGKLITNHDLGSVVVEGEGTSGIIIEYSAEDIDGRGRVLGQAGPTYTRTTNGLPCKGVMSFDSSDLEIMERDNILEAVILHEMGHVLGIGTLWRSFIINYNTDPQYVGRHAVEQYNRIRESMNLPRVGSVAVENTGGPGTYSAHWRESVFNTELMTGEAEAAGVKHPLSRITAGALVDLGYQVDYNQTDELPALPHHIGPRLKFGYDMVRPLVRTVPAAQEKATAPKAK